MRRDTGICVLRKEEGGAGDVLECVEDAIDDELVVVVVAAAFAVVVVKSKKGLISSLLSILIPEMTT